MVDRVLREISENGIMTLTLNREGASNAIDEELIQNLHHQFVFADKDETIRTVVLAAVGKNFCAGADREWMHRMSQSSLKENKEDARQFGQMLQALYHLKKPTIALLKGAVYGSGIGLAACADVVIATDTSSFCFSEAKFGLIPAIISPFVMRVIGERNALRYFLTAERFGAYEAQRIGLVHEVVSPAELEPVADHTIRALFDGAPASHRAIKSLVREIEGAPLDNALLDKIAKNSAEVRISKEGKEGVEAFLTKTLPSWRST